MYRKGTKRVGVRLGKNIPFILQGRRLELSSHFCCCLLAYFDSFLKCNFYFLFNKHCIAPGYCLKHLTNTVNSANSSSRAMGEEWIHLSNGVTEACESKGAHHWKNFY